MTTFLEDESGTETSIPREGYSIEYPSVTYRLTPHTRDQTLDGLVYRKSTISRGEIGVSTTSGKRELSFTLPISHPLVQRWMANSTPPRRITVNFYRGQRTSGQVEHVWSGYIAAMSLVDLNLARFRVPSKLGSALERRLPTISADELCPHILYDENCRVDRLDGIVYAAITEINGNTVKLSTISGQVDGWADWGELLHLASLERMTVREQVGTLVTMQAGIVEMHLGDAIELYAGCDHSVATCRSKFSNEVNFGGFPDMPDNNIFIPTGFGVIVQS